MSLTYEVNGVIVCHPLNWYNCPAGGLRVQEDSMMQV